MYQYRHVAQVQMHPQDEIGLQSDLVLQLLLCHLWGEMTYDSSETAVPRDVGMSHGVVHPPNPLILQCSDITNPYKQMYMQFTSLLKFKTVEVCEDIACMCCRSCMFEQVVIPFRIICPTHVVTNELLKTIQELKV